MGLDGELWLGGLSLSVDPLQTAAHQVELSLLLFSYQSRERLSTPDRRPYPDLRFRPGGFSGGMNRAPQGNHLSPEEGEQDDDRDGDA